MTVKNGTAVKLAGDPHHPGTGGGLCATGNQCLERVSSPQRVLTPLRRDGAEGGGDFVPVSWDEALGERPFSPGVMRTRDASRRPRR